MEFRIDPNVRQIYADLQGLSREYHSESGLKIFYRYLIANQQLIHNAFQSFWHNSTDETLAELSNMQASYVSGKFFRKEIVKSFFEMCFTEIAPAQQLKLIDFGLGPGDEYEIQDVIEQAWLTLGPIMHFSQTDTTSNREMLLAELDRKYKKSAIINRFGDETITITIEGGLVEGENEQQFEKINFSFGNNRLAFEAEEEIPGFNSPAENYVSFFEKPFRRLIYYPAELKSDLLLALRRNEFEVRE